MSTLHRVRLAATLICAASAWAQTPDAATLDAWWQGSFAQDAVTQAASRARLQEHAEAAVQRGIELLRARGEPSGQPLAFAIAGLGDPAWVALRRESLDADSPVRALALEGLRFFGDRFLDDRHDAAILRQELRETAVACLDTRDEEVLRQLDFAISSHDDATRTLLEQRLTAPAPVGPRAALFLDERAPHPPLPALLAALEDPCASVRARAFTASSQRSDPEARAGMLRGLRRAEGDARQAAAHHLALWNNEPWGEDLVKLLAEYVGAPLPAPLAADWFENLSAREHVVATAARRITDGEEHAARAVPILLTALGLPETELEAGWIRYRVDAIRAAALRGLLALGNAMPSQTVDLVTALAAREPMTTVLQEVIFAAHLRLAPPRASERAPWLARYRSAIDSALAQDQAKGTGRGPSYQTAVALAATYGAIGRLGDRVAVPWLQEQLAGDGPARGAVAGALVRLTGNDAATRAAVRRLLEVDAGKWSHDEVLAAALADEGSDWAWTVPALLARLPETATDSSGSVVDSMAAIAANAPASARQQIFAALLAELRGNPRHGHAEELADTIVSIDPAGALALRTESEVGQRLYLAVAKAQPECIVPLLDCEDRTWANYTHDWLRSYGRPEPKTLAAFTELLQRELRDPALVLRTLTAIGPTPEMLPVIENWFLRCPEALPAMVAVGAPAVPRIAAVCLPQLQPRDLEALRPLGELGEPLIPALLAHPIEQTREMVRYTLPFFGQPGLAALRGLALDEPTFCNLLTLVFVGTRASETVQVVVADELLLHPDVPGVGYHDLVRDAKSPELKSRLLLLQGSRDATGAGATEALLDALAASEPKIRAFAVRSLAAHPDRERIDAYLHWLREDASPEVQRAIEALAAVRRGR